MAYHLTLNLTNRAFPARVDSDRIMRLAKRARGESVGFDNGGDLALIFDADGRTLAQYDYRARCFSVEAYLNN